MTDPRRFAPSAARNRDPILALLHGILPSRGLVLEVASGSGEHAIHFAAAMPALTFQPSDPDPDARASIDACRQLFGACPIKIGAQSYLLRFYESFGFVSTGEEYLEDGIPHTKMVL